MSENRVLRGVFESKREEVEGGWRRLHNEEFHNLYTSPNVIRVINSRRVRRVGYVACRGEMRKAYKILVGKPEEKRSLGKTRRRWEDNIRMDLREIGWECVYWIQLAQDRDQWQAVVKTVMYFRVP
jgi:hypothetical protein